MKKLKTTKIFVLFLMSVFFVILIISCAGMSYSGLRMSGEVNNLFESYQVLEDYNYYYSGPDARPHAILGVHKDYTLRSNLWKPVDLTPDQLRLWVNMMTDHKGTALRTYGARVVAPDEREIGIWYSPWSQTAVRLEDDGQVIINTPVPSPVNRKRGVFFGMEADF
jgi:hypothetical protein